MKSRKIDHIGIAVESLEKSLAFYEKFFFLYPVHREQVPSQEVEVAFLKQGETYIELLQAISPESSIAKFIEKRGAGMHHIAFLCDDIQESLHTFKEQGAVLINEAPVIGAWGKKVAFIHPKSSDGVLIELCEKK